MSYVDDSLKDIKRKCSFMAEGFKDKSRPDDEYINIITKTAKFVNRLPVSLRRSAAGMAMCYSMYYDGSMSFDQSWTQMSKLEDKMRVELSKLLKTNGVEWIEDFRRNLNEVQD